MEMISTEKELAFEVKRCEPELIGPAKPTPHEFKQLSDIDEQESLRFHIPIIQFYPHNPNMDGKDPVKVIKQAVAETLVFYYPFAGRLREDHGTNKKVVVECNGEGILFVEANIDDVSLEQFENVFQPPIFSCMDRLLYDSPIFDRVFDSPLLLIQVTRFKCGGFTFAIRFNHMICDGSGLVQFLKATAQMAHGAISTPSTFPKWERTLLISKNETLLPTPIDDNDENDDDPTIISFNNMTYRSFFFGPTQISNIRKTLPIQLSNCTTFELLSAYIWRLRTQALELNPNEELIFSCVVNLRTKLGFLPLGYYGNAVGFSKATTTAEELCGNSLSYGLEMVKKAKENMSEDYYLKSLDDNNLMEIKATPFVNSTRLFTIINLKGVGFDEVDYGWGKPSYGGLGLGGARLIAMSLCFFIPFKNKQGQNGILVPLCLPTSSMETFVAGLDELLEV